VSKFDYDSNCHYHTHSNSFYSGTFYLSEHEDFLVGKFEVKCENIIPTHISVDADVQNHLNSRITSFIPKKNSLLFFPSYLNHRVGNHMCKNSRYSIAFNIMPTSLYQEDCKLSVTMI
jgi:uncharacterized protein (TIGR02466 family)